MRFTRYLCHRGQDLHTGQDRTPKKTLASQLAVRGLLMLSVILGVAVTGAGGACLWHLMPTNGEVHPLVTRPFLSSLIPIGIVSSLAIGIPLIVFGVLG